MNSSAFGCLIAPVKDENLRSPSACLWCARLGQRETFRTWREGRLRAWATGCQRPGAERSRRRPAFFAGRGLTGRGPRPYPLPASEWLVSYRRELYCRRAAGSFCEVLGQLARLPYCFHSHQNRPLSRSYSSEKIVRSLPQEQWFVPQSMTAQTPNKAQTHTGQQHTRRQRPRFRRYAQPSMDQHVYAKSALQRPAGTH